MLAVTIQFVLQMNRMLGANVLGYFVAGVYRRPKAEERVFLFVDLEGSTQLAERLGSARYFELLRRFVDDLTDPVLESEGEIYQYAGDEVVITWPIAAGVRAANCVRCFFAIRAGRGAAAPPATSGSSAWCRGSAAGSTAAPSPPASWATCGSRSSSSATSSTPPRGWRSTPSGASLDLVVSGRAAGAHRRCRRASRRPGAASSRSGGKDAPVAAWSIAA